MITFKKKIRLKSSLFSEIRFFNVSIFFASSLKVWIHCKFFIETLINDWQYNTICTRNHHWPICSNANFLKGYIAATLRRVANGWIISVHLSTFKVVLRFWEGTGVWLKVFWDFFTNIPCTSVDPLYPQIPTLYWNQSQFECVLLCWWFNLIPNEYIRQSSGE